MFIWASELHHGPMEGLMNRTSFTSLGCSGASLAWGTPGSRMHDGNKLPKETLDPAIHMDVTLTRSTHLSIISDHVRPFVETVLLGGWGLFQQDNGPCHRAKLVHEGTQQRVWGVYFTSKFSDLNPVENLWDMLDKQVRSLKVRPRNLPDLKDLFANILVQIPQLTFRGLLKSKHRDAS